MGMALAFAMCWPVGALAAPDTGEDAGQTHVQTSKESTKGDKSVDKAKSDSTADSKESKKDSDTKKAKKKASSKEKADADAKDVTESSKAKKNLSDSEKKAADKKTKRDKKKEEARKKAELDAKADAVANRLAALTFKLETVTEDLAELNKKIEKQEKSLKKAKKELKKHRKMLKRSKANMAQGAKDMYTDGGTRLMSVLLGATSFEDFASRLFLYEKITTKWREVFDEHEKRAKKVKEDSEKIDAKIQELGDMRKKSQALGDSVAANIAEQEKEISRLDAKLSKLVNKKTEKYLHSLANSFKKANSAAMKWYGGTDGGSTSSKGSHPSIVKIAMQYLGVKYVWAGETPSGFDCSGLTMYCYNKIGISLPHSARMQYSCGTHVAREALMPGDLVFFGHSIAGIHHVGIYIGDDKYLHAPNTGDVVKVSTFSARSDCVGATRPN